MVTLQELNIINNCPLKIVKDFNDKYFLTTGNYLNTHSGEPCEEGLAMHPSFTIEEIEKGWLIIIQKIRTHTLVITDKDGKPIKELTITPEQNVLDGMDRNAPYYKRYLIENNELKTFDLFCNEFIFHDAPFIPIEDDYNKVIYNIEFETFFTWTDDFNLERDLELIFSFKWFLGAEIEKLSGNWEVLVEHHSSNDEIANTIINDGALDLNLEEYCHIKNLL